METMDEVIRELCGEPPKFRNTYVIFATDEKLAAYYEIQANSVSEAIWKMENEDGGKGQVIEFIFSEKNVW